MATATEPTVEPTPERTRVDATPESLELVRLVSQGSREARYKERFRVVEVADPLEVITTAGSTELADPGDYLVYSPTQGVRVAKSNQFSELFEYV